MAVEVTSGELRHKVVFKQPASSLNSQKERVTTYTDAISTWAKVEKFNQYRTTEANASTLIGALDFYVRYSVERSGITKDWLIGYNGKDYTIHQIELIEQKENFLRFTAKVRE
jgi:SPP1 family predicted phage head-tail adaptor